jgi:hypothetical protein
MNVFKKILDIQNDILVLSGIYFAIRFIYTKELYIQVNGYAVNTLELLIQTIGIVGIYRTMGWKTSSNNDKSLKNNDLEEK